MEEAPEEEPIAETGAGLDSVEEDPRRKLRKRDTKKKEKVVETKKDDRKKPRSSGAAVKKAGPGAKQSAFIKERLQKKQEQEESLQEEEEEEEERFYQEEDAELERFEKHMKENEKIGKKKQKEEKERKERLKKEGKLSDFIWLLIPITIAIVVFGFFYNLNVPQMTPLDRQMERLSRWEKSFSDLMTNYGEVLPVVTRKVIDKNIRRILERVNPSEKYENNEPAVILLLGSTHNAQAIKCVFLNLSRILAGIYGEDQPPIINADKLSKLDLINELHSVLGHKKLHTVVLDGIERLNGNAALSLHPFTDHDKALYLDVIILLTAYTKTPLTNTSLAIPQIDGIANDLLELSWANIPNEHVAALLSRVTPSVALISDTNESRTWRCE